MNITLKKGVTLEGMVDGQAGKSTLLYRLKNLLRSFARQPRPRLQYCSIKTAESFYRSLG